ncbi:MAG: cytochrome c oxidase subunit II [Myxococcota bacterium]
MMRWLFDPTGRDASFWLPKGASSVAAGHDALFYFILYLSTAFFVVIVAAIVLFVLKYRRRSPEQRTSGLHGNVMLEIVWAVIPAILLIVMFVWGFRQYMDMSVPPADAIEVRVTAQKWSWTFEYPRDGISVPKDLVVPVGRPVRLTMSSLDVIHSFFVPAFRIKKDVLPNRYTMLWFEATEVGEYDLECAEYCGTAHSQMLGKIIVKPENEYNEWIAAGGGMSGEGMSSVAFGARLFSQLGCAVCHSTDGTKKTGPSVLAKFGSTETFVDGTKALVDDNYVRESLMDPAAKVVVGYEAVMPTFKGRLSDKQTNALVDYIKSLAPADDGPKEP